MKRNERKTIAMVVIVFGAVFPSVSNAMTPPSSNATCVACHGDAGVSVNDAWPNLAGQKRGYLREQLGAFKSGARVNPLMNPIVQMLSDIDMDELAQYYSSLSPQVAK